MCEWFTIYGFMLQHLVLETKFEISSHHAPLNSVIASTAHKAKYAERSDVAFLWLGLSSDPPVALVIPQRRPITPDLMKSMAHVCPFYAGIPPLFSVLFLPPCFVFSAVETINLQQSAEYLYLLTFPHFTSSVNQASNQRLNTRMLWTSLCHQMSSW